MTIDERLVAALGSRDLYIVKLETQVEDLMARVKELTAENETLKPAPAEQPAEPPASP